MREKVLALKEMLGEDGYCYILDKTTASRMTSRFDEGIAVVIKHNYDDALNRIAPICSIKFSSKQVGYYFLVVE